MKKLACLLQLIAVALWGTPVWAQQAQLKMVTASERGTYIVVCRDIAAHVVPEAGFDLDCLPSAGSAENVSRLRFEPFVKFAIVQSDVMQALSDQAKAGNKAAGNLIKPLRVILPLYNEEIYLIVRADSPLNYVQDMKDARINAGPQGSGTALTALTLYQRMFGAPLPPTTTYMSNEDALLKLTGDKSVDVVAIVGGQPMKLLAEMKPEAKALLKILKFDPLVPASKEALKTYFAATIKKASYPNLLDADQPGVAVKAYLVTYDYNLAQTQLLLKKFAKSLCTNMESLQKFGHPKWKEVELALPELGEAWSYYPPTAAEIYKCGKPVPKVITPAVTACSQQEVILGLCK